MAREKEYFKVYLCNNQQPVGFVEEDCSLFDKVLKLRKRPSKVSNSSKVLYVYRPFPIMAEKFNDKIIDVVTGTEIVNGINKYSKRRMPVPALSYFDLKPINGAFVFEYLKRLNRESADRYRECLKKTYIKSKEEYEEYMDALKSIKRDKR